MTKTIIVAEVLEIVLVVIAIIISSKSKEKKNMSCTNHITNTNKHTNNN